MSGDLRIPSTAVLKNRGVPVSLHVLEVDEDGRLAQPITRVLTDDGEPVLEEKWLQFTVAALADLEDDHIGWGSAEAWEEALSTKPGDTLTRTLAIMLQMWVPGGLDAAGNPIPDRRRAGHAMIDGEVDAYATAVGVAFMLANGVSPEAAGEALRAGVKQAKELRPLIDAEVAKMLEAAADDTPTSPQPSTPSPNGSEAGLVSAGPSASSGD